MSLLPLLPGDVLELIYEFVRSDLRPRMRRRLKEEVRLASIDRLLCSHGKWLLRAHPVFFNPANELSILCAFCNEYGFGNVEDVFSPANDAERNRVPGEIGNQVKWLLSVVSLYQKGKLWMLV